MSPADITHYFLIPTQPWPTYLLNRLLNLKTSFALHKVYEINYLTCINKTLSFNLKNINILKCHKNCTENGQFDLSAGYRIRSIAFSSIDKSLAPSELTSEY